MMQEQYEKYDGLFASLADGVQGIENLVDAFFGFLGRKTDFYYPILKDPSAKDISKEIVLKSYEHHKENAKKIYDNIEKTKKKNETKYESNIPQQITNSVRSESNSTCPVVEVFDETSPNNDEPVYESFDQHKQKQINGPVSEKHSQVLSEGEGNDEDTRPPVGNGGTTDKYTWTQTLGTVDIMIPLKSQVHTSRQCKVDVTFSHLKVIVNNETILDGEFHDKVKATECLWTLEDRKVIHITLEKQEGMKWWSCVLEGDPSIDTKKIQPENSKLSDLDPELRQTVEKMMFDQDQKARGLPTSDQRKQAEILEAFKKQHPEMDFSQAKINWGSNQFANNF